MNVKEIIICALKKDGFDGLCNGDGDCGCGIFDLVPCNEDFSNCEPAYLIGETDFEDIYSTEKPEVKP